ncbi:MAG: DUF177 domain-containing protein [Flavobacteriaceae bacterium]|nr:DUF177 domain-containing protein [Flavobacteriaceae bacterium]
MNLLKAYDIHFSGLKIGNHVYEYEIDGKFFENYDYEDFNDVNAHVSLNFHKNSNHFELDFNAQGVANVNCDLTNEPYDQAFKGSFRLVVNFGVAFDDTHDEILIIPHGESTINVAQYIYELIVLSVPMKRTHPGIKDRSLPEEILQKLDSLNTIQPKTNETENDPRWDNLKILLTHNKQNDGTS